MGFRFYVRFWLKSSLVDSDGIKFVDNADIGLQDDLSIVGWGQDVFNFKGDLYVRHNATTGTEIMDFDRSSGKLSNLKFLPVPIEEQFTSNDGGGVYGGATFSPDGRFLYVSNESHVFQYDLSATDILASKVEIADLEYRIVPGLFDATTTIHLQLGPDCKIYVFGISGDEIHIIHRPNEKGAACEWETTGIALPSVQFRDTPYFPHFRLGSSDNIGSPCVDYSSVSTTNGSPYLKESLIAISPNPTIGPLSVTLRHRTNVTELRWRLYDSQGRGVREVSMSGTPHSVRVERDGLPAGLYVWELVGANGSLERGRIIYH